MKTEQLARILEAAIFAAGHPMPVDHMVKLFAEHNEQPTRDEIKAALLKLAASCEDRGVELRQLATGYQFQSKQDYAPWLQKLWEEKPPRYSRALLETLALIAYKQPITRGEIEDVRGVAVSTHIIKTLMEREWVKVAGHKEVPGRPALYATTKAFLDYFNLKSIKELPALDELRDLEEIGKQFDLPIEPSDEAADTPKQVQQVDASESDEPASDEIAPDESASDDMSSDEDLDQPNQASLEELSS